MVAMKFCGSGMLLEACPCRQTALDGGGDGKQPRESLTPDIDVSRVSPSPAAILNSSLLAMLYPLSNRGLDTLPLAQLGLRFRAAWSSLLWHLSSCSPHSRTKRRQWPMPRQRSGAACRSPSLDAPPPWAALPDHTHCAERSENINPQAGPHAIIGVARASRRQAAGTRE